MMPDNNINPYTELAMRSRFVDHPVNEAIHLYQGQLNLSSGETTTLGQGSLEVAFLPRPQIRFVLKTIEPYSGPTMTTIETPITQFPAKAIVTRVNQDSVQGILNGGSLEHGLLKPDGTPEPVGRVEFHLLNFLEYSGREIQRDPNYNSRPWRGRVTFEFDKWHVTLDQMPDVNVRLDQAEATSGFAITHMGILQRKDGKLFSVEQAKNVLECLHWLFAFIRGSLSACILPIGLRRLEVPVWYKWDISKTSPAKHTNTWFHNHHPALCLEVSTPFFATWQNNDKQGWLKLGVGLYVAANRIGLSPELALVNAQIALELLSWVALVEENSVLSTIEFNTPPAFRKFDKLVSWCSTPLSIPSSLEALKAAFPRSSGPEAITDIRNSIMHPTKSNRIKRHSRSDHVAYEAWQLSMYYIELALLKLIGYTGPYKNRFGNAPGRAFDLVPWSPIVLEQVRTRAYFHYENQTGDNWRDEVSNWLQAENELLAR